MCFQGIIKFGNISNYFDSRDIKFRPEPGKQKIRLAFSLRKESCGDKRSSLLRREKEKLSALQLSLFSHTLLKILGRSPCTTYLLINWSLKNITKESKGRILLCLKSGKVCELYLLEVTILIAFFCLSTSSFRLLCAVELHIWMP